MKRSTMSGKELGSTVSRLSAAISLGTSNVFNVDEFKKNVELVMQHVTSYVPNAANEAKQCKHFVHLIAMDGEDNQTKAEAMLRQHPGLASHLIVTPMDVVDAAGRHFLKPLSAYEYAYWAGDTRMRHMMERYMDNKTTSKVFVQCQRMEERGVAYMLNGEHVERSTHFDFQPVIEAYEAYLDAATALIKKGDDSHKSWSLIDALWLDIGKKQAEFPTYLAQEYCSNQPFTPLKKYTASFEHVDSKRTVKFYNMMSSTKERWYARGQVNPELGTSFTVFKGNCVVGGVCGSARVWVVFVPLIPHDLAAIRALNEARFENNIV